MDETVKKPVAVKNWAHKAGRVSFLFLGSLPDSKILSSNTFDDSFKNLNFC